MKTITNTLTVFSRNMPHSRRTTVPTMLLVILFMAIGACGLDMVVATSFDKYFPDKWTHAASNTTPHLSNRDTVYADLPWRIHVLFKGYTRDYSGNVDVSLGYNLLKPDGTLFYDTAGITALSGPVAGDNALLLSYRIPIVVFSRKDVPGNYRLIITAEDNVGSIKKTIEKTLILAKYPAPTSGNFTDITFNVWIHSYCIDPDPGRAVSAFACFIGSNMSNDNDLFWPVFYFFQSLFGDNPALVQILAATFPKSSTRLQEYMVLLFRTIQIPKSSLPCPIPDSLWIKFDKVAATGPREPFTDAVSTGSNRLMEFGFYYYGKYSLIRFLIDCLGADTPAGYGYFLKSCGGYGVDYAKYGNRETARQLRADALLILKKTYSRHALINAYCNYALENEAIGIDAKKVLREIAAPPTK